MLKLKLQYFGHLMWRVIHWKRPWCWENWRQEEKGTTEDEMVGWHYQLKGHEFEQAPGDGDGQGSLACCSLWGCKELDTTEQLKSKYKLCAGKLYAFSLWLVNITWSLKIQVFWDVSFIVQTKLNVHLMWRVPFNSQAEGQGPLRRTLQFSSVAQSVRLFATPWIAACQASLSITNSQSLPKLMSRESVMPSNHLMLCRPLLLPPSTFPSIRDFSNESVLWIRWPEYWSFSFSISPSNEHPGLISFRINWLDLLAVQGTLKSLLQHYSSKAWILRCSAFFIAQLSQPYMATGKTIALTRWTFVGKVMSLLFKMDTFILFEFHSILKYK